MPRILKGIRVVSKLAATRAIDNKEHTAGRLLPEATIDGEDGKAFATAINAYLALNKAIIAGEKIELVGQGRDADGNVVEKIKEVTASDVAKEGGVVVPSKDLPTTYVEIIDLINAAMIAKHRNQLGAFLSSNFDKQQAGKTKSTEAGPIDVDDIG